MAPARKRIALAVLGVTLLGSAPPIYIVGVTFNLWQPFTRPSEVSQRARYVSAFESGGWFHCSVNAGRDVDVCRAWNEEGRLIAFGNYRLDGENRAATQQELRPWQVNPGPNGNPRLGWIYLSASKNGAPLVLVPVNEAGKTLERFEAH